MKASWFKSLSRFRFPPRKGLNYLSSVTGSFLNCPTDCGKNNLPDSSLVAAGVQLMPTNLTWDVITTIHITVLIVERTNHPLRESLPQPRFSRRRRDAVVLQSSLNARMLQCIKHGLTYSL